VDARAARGDPGDARRELVAPARETRNPLDELVEELARLGSRCSELAAQLMASR
jgi:hypothetical protein